MKRIRAAAVQIAPDFHSATGTVDRVCDAIDRAAAQGVRLAVFPETFVPYYPYFSFVLPPVASGKEHMRLYDFAVEVPGPVTEQLSKAAAQHGMVVVIGVNERDGGSIYNAQLVFDADGSLLLKRRKITPTYHERMVWGQGDGSGFRAVDTTVGRLGTHSRVGSITIRSRVSPSWKSAKRFTARSFLDRWSGKFLPTRSKSRSATTRSSPVALW